jgi:hypothetical protein
MKSPPLELTRRLETARQLHFKLNRAIADQDLPTLKSIACAGLMANIKSRLDAQKSTKKVRDTWSLVRYNGLRPPRWIPWPISSFIPNRAIKVVHDIIAPLPIGGKDASIRQVVVRMKSRQSFNRQDGKGLQTKELTEYVVIQKMTADGLDKDWMIWGTVLPSTAEQIDSIFEMEELTAGSGIWDKVKNLMPMGGGGGAGGASMM